MKAVVIPKPYEVIYENKTMIRVNRINRIVKISKFFNLVYNTPNLFHLFCFYHRFCSLAIKKVYFFKIDV